MTTQQPPGTRTLACHCDDGIICVLELSPAVARELLDRRQEVLALKKQRPGVVRVVYDNLSACRFFHATAHDADIDLEPLFVAVKDDDCDDCDPVWHDVPAAVVPEGGDYRTAFERLEIGEFYIGFVAQGKHAADSFESAELTVALLEEVAGVRT